MSSLQDFANAAPGAEGFRPDHPVAAHLPILDANAGRINWFGTGRKKVAICGFASSSRHLIPFDNPAWSLIGLNQLYRHGPRFDVWIDIHRNWDEENVPGTDHAGWLAACGLPVLMSERAPGIPTAVRYPVERLIKKFGVDYFTSTISFLLALLIDAIDENVEADLSHFHAAETTNGHAPASAASVLALAKTLYAEYAIGIFGVDLIVGEEYSHQKPCTEFWIGQALARNITMTIPAQSALLKQRWRYGYQQAPTGSQLRPDEYTKRSGFITREMAKVQAEVEKLMGALRTWDGALQECQHHERILELREKGGEYPLSPEG